MPYGYQPPSAVGKDPNAPQSDTTTGDAHSLPNSVSGETTNATHDTGFWDGMGKMMGVGTYDPQVYMPNKNAYTNEDSNYYKTMMGNRLAGIDSRGAPTMNAAQLGPANGMASAALGPAAQYGGASVDQTQADQGRAYQMRLMDQLYDTTQGKGPSLAGMQLQQGLQGSLANQMAAAASNIGTSSNPALAERQQQLAAAQGNQALVGQSAIMRMQEQQAAQSQLAGLSSGIRAQDLGVAGQNAGFAQQAGLANMGAQNQYGLAQAGFDQQRNEFNANAQNQYGLAQAQMQQGANQANLNAYLQNQGMNDSMSQYYTGAQMGLSEKDRQSAMDYENAQMQAQQAYNASAQQAYSEAAAGRRKLVGGVMTALGGMMSDENQKTGITDGSSSLKSMLGSSSGGGDTGGGSSPGGDLMSFLSKYTAGMGAAGATPGAPMGGGQSLGMSTMARLSNDDDYHARLAQTQQMAQAEQAHAASAGGGDGGGDSGGGGGLGGITDMLSDEDQKTGIHDDPKDLRRFLGALGVHEYSYKDPSLPGAAPGRHVSPMAQELEKSEIGRQAVVDTPQGKMVNYGRLAGPMLSAEAMHQKKIDEIDARLATVEGKGKKR